MTRSEAINELAAALAAAQGEIVAARRDAENPHFRARYAGLGATWDACRDALARHGLAVVQSPRLNVTGESVWFVEVETTLVHGSGQWIADTLAMPIVTPNPQGVGSALTYARRYALAAFVGVAPAGDDDDGAGGGDGRPSTPPPPVRESATVHVLGIVKRAGVNGRDVFVISGDDERTYQTGTLAHATTAKAAKAANHGIEITFVKNPGGGREIVALRAAPGDDPALPEPPL